jgi:hypothetical protein
VYCKNSGYVDVNVEEDPMSSKLATSTLRAPKGRAGTRLGGQEIALKVGMELAQVVPAAQGPADLRRAQSGTELGGQRSDCLQVLGEIVAVSCVVAGMSIRDHLCYPPCIYAWQRHRVNV